MAKFNHKCCLTGNQYYFNESNYSLDEQYKLLCDTKMHYDIYQVILNYVRGTITKSAAKSSILALDISDKDEYKYVNSCLISEILNDSIPDRSNPINNSTDIDLSKYYTKEQVNGIISGLTINTPSLLSDLEDNSIEYPSQDIYDIMSRL